MGKDKKKLHTPYKNLTSNVGLSLVVSMLSSPKVLFPSRELNSKKHKKEKEYKNIS